MDEPTENPSDRSGPTPGPWLAEDHTVYALTTDDRGNEVNRFWATVQSARRPYEAESAELLANARLMATAPRLLVALTTVMQWLDAWGSRFQDDEEWLADEAAIRATIAQATERTSDGG